MRRFKFVAVLVTVVSGCYQTENGLVLGRPNYEERNIEVSKVDLDILLKTNELLRNESNWEKDNVRVCIESSGLSLVCAREKASIAVTSTYEHRQATLQEDRFVINDCYRNRWSVHRLGDFKAHPDTTLADVKLVIVVASEETERQLA